MTDVNFDMDKEQEYIAVDEAIRFDRQKRIWGDDGQEKLSKAKVAVIGSGPLARYTALPLVALGIGEVRVISDEKSREGEMLMDIPLTNSYRVEGIERALQLLNPTSTTIGIPQSIHTLGSTKLIEGVDVIIDATNDPISKQIAHQTGLNHSIPYFSASTSLTRGKMVRAPLMDQLGSALMLPFEGKQQHPVISLLYGALLTEAAKKIILGGTHLARELHYTLGDGNIFTYPGDQIREGKPIDNSLFADKSAFAIGAGALGTFMAIALADIGFSKIDFLDYDTIESHNLSRQVLYYDAVDKHKATVIADKFMKMNPGAHSRGIVDKLTVENGVYSLDHLCDQEYDIYFDLVDNLYARAVFSAYAVTNGYPLITAGSAPDGSKVASYVPGITACFDHQFTDYYSKGKELEMIRRQSCIDQPDPSVVITNQAAAALAALEMMKLFSPDYKSTFNGSLKYNTDKDYRLGTVPINEVCDCHTHPEDIPDLTIDIPDIGEEL